MGDRHCRLRVSDNTAPLYVSVFNTSPNDFLYHEGDVVDVLIQVSLYEGKKGTAVSATLKDIRPAGQENLMAENYAQYARIFSQFTLGKKNADIKRIFKPSRTDCAELYRMIRSDGMPTADLRPSMNKLGNGKIIQYLIALKALEQLELIKIETVNQQGKYTVSDVKTKKD